MSPRPALRALRALPAAGKAPDPARSAARAPAADRDTEPAALDRAESRPVLITGGAGFLGSNLADRLAGRGQRVLVLDNLARAGVAANLAWLRARHGDRIVHLAADVRDAAAVRDAVRGVGAVLHLAAQVAVTTSVLDPIDDFEINARGTLNLLEALRRQGGTTPLVFASTNKVYGQLLDEGTLERTATRWQPVDPARRKGCDERTPLDFHSPYGCSKGVADQYVLDYARVFGLPTLVFRMSCLYGPRQLGTEDQGWVAHFLIRALEGRPITLYGDGRQVRDALFVDDAVEAWLTGLARIGELAGRAFNLGGGPSSTVSLVELLAMIPDLLAAAGLTGLADPAGGGIGGRRPAVRHEAWRPGDQRWYVSDTAAFETAAGWRRRVDLADGLARLLAWLREHRAAAPAPEEAVA